MAHAKRPERALEGLDLEAGLEAAFEGSSAPAESDASVLAKLRSDGRPVVPLMLRDAEEVAGLSPVVRPSSGELTGVRGGRYRVVGEIARGGVGVVLKGQDVDLGRDVAMKVIRKEHGDNPEMIQRFVEEAQIGGQLQHPGIVPVYEVGLGDDRRPYFTMKLVKGRTLSALLTKRASPRQARRRFLTIFESVCQTMGYAHARGVIHRDLKPSNVMVGAFGEVLVVDWGMGKVLRSGGVEDERSARIEADRTLVSTHRSKDDGSDSVIGSVMGTPRYMPPEQARGDVDAVDERSDVFGLGAILCEILTGQPPYLGEGREALAQAATGELAGALERLDECGADPQLVALTKRCLAPAKRARPENAGELAGLIGRYLGGLEAKFEESKLAAARAEEAARTAKRLARQEQRAATQARQSRRVIAGLSAAILAFVLLGAWIRSGQKEEEQRRLSATAARVDTALGRAEYLAGRAEQTKELELWSEALGEARRAEELLVAGESDEGLRTRVHEALARLEPEAASAATYLADLEEGSRLRREGKPDAALAVFRRLAQAKPAIPLAHQQEGSVLAGFGRFLEAHAAYERAAPFASSPQFLIERAAVLQSLMRYEEARAILRKGVASHPDHGDLINSLANVLPEEDRHEKIALYYRAASTPIANGPAAFNLRKRYEIAVEDDDERVLRGDLMPRDPMWLSQLAQKCGAGKRWRDAVRLWERCFAGSSSLEHSIVDGHLYRMAAAGCALRAWADSEDSTEAEALAYLEKFLSWTEAHVASLEEAARTANPSKASNLLNALARHHKLPKAVLGGSLGSRLRDMDGRRLEKLGRRFEALWLPLARSLCEADSIEDATRHNTQAMLAYLGAQLSEAGEIARARQLAELAYARGLEGTMWWGSEYALGCLEIHEAADSGKDPRTARSHREKGFRLLESALSKLEDELESRPGPTRVRLEEFRREGYLASVRGEALEDLPRAEREVWERLWERIDGLLSEKGAGSQDR